MKVGFHLPKYNQLFALIIYILVQIGYSSDCINPKTSQDYLLQSGVSQIVNTQYELSNSCYQINLQFTPPVDAPYDVVLSTSQIQSNNNNDMDYSLRSSKQANSFKIALVSNKDNWRKLSISYLVSARNDLFAGSFIVDTLSYFGCDGNQTRMTNEIVIQNARFDSRNFTNNATFSVSIFISGLQTYPLSSDSNIVNFRVSGQKFRPAKSLLTFNILSQTLRKFVQIEFHYLLILDNMELNYELAPSTGSGSIQNIFQYPTQYTFSGQVGLNSRNDQRNQFSNINIVDVLVSCKGSKCKNSCISQKQCSNTGGILSNSSIANQVCLLQCGQNQIYNSNNQCECAYGFRRATNNLTSPCQQIVLRLNCSANQTINFTTSRCDCRPGNVMIRNTCVASCNVNGFNNGTSCACMTGFRLASPDFCHNCTGPGQSANVTTKTCDCYRPTYAKTLAGKCILNPCPGNQTWIQGNNTCTCANGQVIVDTFCFSQCGENAYFSNGCRCLPGYNRVNSTCRLLLSSCPANQQLDSGRTACLCISGFQKINDGCLPLCGANQIRDQNNVCICANGFKFRSTTDKTCVTLVVNCGSNQVFDQQISSCICANGYERNSSNKCVLSVQSCGTNQIYQIATSKCVCKAGFTNNTNTNICEATSITCGDNAIIVNQSCQCRAGFVRLQTQCVNICGINQEYSTTTNSCQCRTNNIRVSNVCRNCPSESITSLSQPNVCICTRGLVMNGSTNICEARCNQNQQSQKIFFSTDYYFVCYCIDGYQRVNGTCTKTQQNTTSNVTCPTIPNITCPGNSTWNAIRYQCLCNSPTQFISNGSCQSCPTNESWNGNQCVCVTSFNRINGKCLRCDNNSVYDQIQGKCSCNYGFYASSTNIQNIACMKCFQLCGQCSNSGQNNCLSCVNVSYSLSNGSCIKNNSTCSKGFYFTLQNTCQPCSQYCNECQDSNVCKTCVDGFQLEVMDVFGFSTTFCPEICGDGKRFQLDCDDGNKNNGDGCDSSCNIQRGWTCSGGSSASRSACAQIIPSRSFLTVTKPLLLIGQVVQGATLSFVPDRFTSSSCSQCGNLLRVNVIQTNIVPKITVSYLPTSMYKFLITFDFNGIFSIPLFVFTVQINPQYRDFFTTEDMAQTHVIRVDPALLALNDQTQILTLGQANPYNVFSN